jgi:hypothetical protein
LPRASRNTAAVIACVMLVLPVHSNGELTA